MQTKNCCYSLQSYCITVFALVLNGTYRSVASKPFFTFCLTFHTPILLLSVTRFFWPRFLVFKLYPGPLLRGQNGVAKFLTNTYLREKRVSQLSLTDSDSVRVTPHSPFKCDLLEQKGPHNPACLNSWCPVSLFSRSARLKESRYYRQSIYMNL